MYCTIKFWKKKYKNIYCLLNIIIFRYEYMRGPQFDAGIKVKQINLSYPVYIFKRSYMKEMVHLINIWSLDLTVT